MEAKDGTPKVNAKALDAEVPDAEDMGAAAGGAAPVPVEEAPQRVRDLAEACVRFVEKAVGVKLDYEPETLSLLDHYLLGARAAAAERPAAGELVAHAAGAYFGEVVRRRYASWWRFDGDDPSGWRIELQPVYLSFRPVQLVADAIFREQAVDKAAKSPSAAVTEAAGAASDARADEAAGADEDPDAAKDTRADEDASERLELEEEDRHVVAARLGELPEVSEDEFYALSTRLEVIDIAVEAIRGRRLAEDDGDSMLGPDDYEPMPS
jgi:hypothetical protein